MSIRSWEHNTPACAFRLDIMAPRREEGRLHDHNIAREKATIWNALARKKWLGLSSSSNVRFWSKLRFSRTAELGAQSRHQIKMPV